MNKVLKFETERLLLRPTTLNDAPFIYELMNTPKWHQFIGDRKITSEQKAREYIELKMLPQLERLGFTNNTVIRKSDNQKLGTCGLYDREGLEGLDIGFAFLPQYEGQGYGYESAKVLMDAAFNQFGMTMVDAITSKENHASQKLVKKLGMSLEGTVTLPGDDEELLRFRITK